MEEITLHVGTVTAPRGFVQDHRRPVVFQGEELARLSWWTGNDDSRGMKQTLYRTKDGRLVVYVEDWSRWAGEASHYYLRQVEEADLDVGGEFEDLGREAGMARPLTLDEALGEG
ncbi:MAG: hypothetical protein KatS3mg050_1841 [Litorilinea sp.]|nr:MAG: hypothetical protein KatS3mg050_1841 [Litorilinea sp.]